MKAIIVTGYIPLDVTHRSRAEYCALGARLFSLGLPTVALVDPACTIPAPNNVTLLPTTFEDCWYGKLVNAQTTLPSARNLKKDTLNHFVVQHQKTSWVCQALEHAEADYAMWVDFGIYNLGDLSAAISAMFKQLMADPPRHIAMPAPWFAAPQSIDTDNPQWYCAGGVYAASRTAAKWFDQEARRVAKEHLAANNKTTWEAVTWAQVMQKNPERFERYSAKFDASLFSGFQSRQRASNELAKMKIAVYALAKNEEKHAAAWAESCKEADYRVVTDTGSTDRTPDILRAAGVNVHTGNVVPWRWDEAHNLSLHHVPSNADVCVRLDLDERFKPGWRQAIEKAWTPGMTKLRYMYTWSMTPEGKPLKKFPSDRVHARSGYRWVAATHEGLVKWNGEEVMGWSSELEILHYRDPGKIHSTDFELLKVAVSEMPLDARMHWYLARQMDYDRHPDAIAMFTKYLDMPGGSTLERAYACRALARLIPDKADYWYTRAIQEEPAAPEGYHELAKRAHEKKDYLAAFFWAKQAVVRNNVSAHTSDPEAAGHLPADIAAVNAYLLGLTTESLHYTRIAVERNPTDERLQKNLEQLEEQCKPH